MRLVWVTQAAFASRDLMGPPGRVVEVRTGTAQRCQDPPTKNYGGKSRLVEC
jgi:hypothetical protein